ncbi:Transcriptional adapter 1 [Homalodisca vitripennis]|nr:Transcriptional adapter 1 [Homalodisca vitripennis]
MCTKETFDFQARKLLDPSQIHLHNTYLLQLLVTRSKQDLTESSKRFPFKGTKRKTEDDSGFQPVDVHDYVQDRIVHKHHMESAQYCVQDLLLPDSELISMKLVMVAGEHCLEGASPGSAELLVIAVQHFIKNILQAIFSRRNGFRIREDTAQYGIGLPAPNPWLRNSIGLTSDRNNGVLPNTTQKEEVSSISNPSEGEIQQDVALTYAAGLDPPHKPPVTALECFEALQMYRDTVKSNGMYSINMERIAARMNHPSWDHKEE